MNYSFDEVKKQWINKLNNMAQGDTFNLYIDNPFCVHKCEYCVYTPYVTKVNSPIFKKYYSDFMPRELEKYKDIIGMRVPDSVYFGGGTAGLVDCKQMKKIFEQIPNFKNIKCKIYENHPNFLTKEKVDLMIEYGFKYISIGIQTFNEEILRKQNRMVPEYTELRELIKHAQDNGIVVNCDILPFIEDGNMKGLKQFEEDIKKMEELLSPDSITIYPKYQELMEPIDSEYDQSKATEIDEKNYDLIVNLRRSLKKISRRSKLYSISHENLVNLEREKIMECVRGNYYLIKIDKEKFEESKVYFSSSIPRQPATQNTLAIGGLLERKTYSYHGKGFCYYNNVDENFNIEYECGGN